MSTRWMKAAVRYEMAKLAGFKARKAVQSTGAIPTLKRFLESHEWVKEAKKLLAAVGLYVVLGDKGFSGGRRVVVILDKDGLKRYVKGNFKTVGIQEANRLLAEIHHDNPVFDPVLFIRQELDRIADAAP